MTTSQSLSSTLPLEAPLLTDQAHHWLIANQNGETSDGVCKRCGAHREFINGFIWPHPATAGRPPARDAALTRERWCCEAFINSG